MILLLGSGSAVHAAPASDAQTKLAVLQRVLASENQNNAKYRAAASEAASILKDLQNKLVKQTAVLQQTEQAVQALQDKQTATQQAIDSLQQELMHQHAKLATLLMAAQRLQRVPPEAMLLRPGEPIDAARTNLLLQNATPEIAAQAHAIKDDLQRLAALQNDLATQGQALAALQAKQQKQQAALTTDIKTRESLAAATKAKTAQSDAKIADLQHQTADLKAILADLARRPQSLASQPAKKHKTATAPGTTDTADDETDTSSHGSSWGQSLLSFFKGHGPRRMPVTGQIRIGYDDRLASGARSQGLYIAGAPGGVVTAPENGTIRFAGPFRQYRLLVIIEHAGGYHSLLGGLHDVYPAVGDTVAAGEPIGKLPANSDEADSDAAHANLYYEVRQGGKPVDPRDLHG